MIIHQRKGSNLVDKESFDSDADFTVVRCNNGDTDIKKLQQSAIDHRKLFVIVGEGVDKNALEELRNKGVTIFVANDDFLEGASDGVYKGVYKGEDYSASGPDIINIICSQALLHAANKSYTVDNKTLDNEFFYYQEPKDIDLRRFRESLEAFRRYICFSSDNFNPNNLSISSFIDNLKAMKNPEGDLSELIVFNANKIDVDQTRKKFKKSLGNTEQEQEEAYKKEKKESIYSGKNSFVGYIGKDGFLYIKSIEEKLELDSENNFCKDIGVKTRFGGFDNQGDKDTQIDLGNILQFSDPNLLPAIEESFKQLRGLTVKNGQIDPDEIKKKPDFYNVFHCERVEGREKRSDEQLNCTITPSLSLGRPIAEGGAVRQEEDTPSLSPECPSAEREAGNVQSPVSI